MALRTTSGKRAATLVALLVLVAILGIATSIAAQSWTRRILREKEQELLFRGLAYKRALESYAKATPAGASPRPARIGDLLMDDRSSFRIRHLRQAYVDPLTGDAFVLLFDAEGRVRGVVSGDTRPPLKTSGFPDEIEEFALARTYGEWRFLGPP